jgi:hypothetical protein
LHGLVAAQGLQGLQGLAAAQGLQGLVAAQGLHGLHGLFAAQGLQGLAAACRRGTTQSDDAAPAPAAHGLQGLQGLHAPAAAQGLQGFTAHGLQGLHCAICSGLGLGWATGSRSLAAASRISAGPRLAAVTPPAISMPAPITADISVLDISVQRRDFTGNTSRVWVPKLPSGRCGRPIRGAVPGGRIDFVRAT